MTSTGIDLDQLAGRREATDPDGIPLTFRKQQFLLPAELPLDAFDPLLDDDLGLLNIVRDIAASEGFGSGLIEALLKPGTIKKARGALEAVFEQLFGSDDYARFKALRPSVADYVRIVQGLRHLYGVSLGEAFASLTSSESGGATPKQTSPASTSSTPAASGAAPDSAPGSSASDASAT